MGFRCPSCCPSCQGGKKISILDYMKKIMPPEPPPPVVVPSVCEVCRLGKFWVDPAGLTHCETCDPPPFESIVARRIERGERASWPDWIEEILWPREQEPFDKPAGDWVKIETATHLGWARKESRAMDWPSNRSLGIGCRRCGSKQTTTTDSALGPSVECGRCGAFLHFEETKDGRSTKPQ